MAIKSWYQEAAAASAWTAFTSEFETSKGVALVGSNITNLNESPVTVGLRLVDGSSVVMTYIFPMMTLDAGVTVYVDTKFLFQTGDEDVVTLQYYSTADENVFFYVTGDES